MLTFVEPQQQNLPVLGSFWGTAYRFNFVCEIFVPFTRCSCSDSAWNMQFPEPSLSEIMKPLSDEILSKFSDRASFSKVLPALRCIWWKFWSNCVCCSKIKEKFCFKNYSLFIFSPSKCLQGCLVHETPNQKSRYFCLFHDSVVSERPRALKAHTCSIHTCTALYSNIIHHWNTLIFSFECLWRNSYAWRPPIFMTELFPKLKISLEPYQSHFNFPKTYKVLLKHRKNSLTL